MATKTKTTNKKTNTSTAPVSGTVATRALYPDERRPNDEKINQYQGATPTRNTKLYHTTTTSPENMDMECQDDQVKMGAPSDRFVPAEFQTVVEGQELKKQRGLPSIAEWQQMNETLQDPHATMRTTQEGQLVQGFHKEPMSHQYTMEENQAAGAGGLRDPVTHMQSYRSPTARLN
jgi:hypothetical protein